jgi:hypothetical protein
MKLNSLAAAIGSVFLFAMWCSTLRAQENSASPIVTVNPGETSSNFIVVSGTLGDIGDTTTNRSGEFDWVHSSDGGTAFGLGVSGYKVDNGDWMFGLGSASFWLSPRWNLELGMSLGAGNDGSAGFIYQKYSAKAMYRVTPKLYLKGQEEFIDIGTSNGHLLGAGVSFLPTRLLSTDLSYRRSVGGNLGTVFVIGRFDMNTRIIQPFAGFAVGQTAPAVFQLQAGQPAASPQFVDGFGGIAVPIFVAKVIFAGEWIQIGAGRRASLTCSLKFPVGRK